MSNAPSLVTPQIYARTAGALYVVIIVAGAFAEMFARASLIVVGDPATTAANIVASESVWRVAYASELVMLVCDVALAMIFYVLLSPVDQGLALLAAFFRLMHVAIYAVTGLANVAALKLLGGAAYLAPFSTEELRALAYLAVGMHGEGYAFALVFFGFSCVFLGILIAQSRFLPRLLGFLLVVAGGCYLTDSFARFLLPSLRDVIFPAILLPPVVAEGGLALWLIVKGVDATKWRKP